MDQTVQAAKLSDPRISTETTPSLVACWSCKGPVAEGLTFCKACKAVQPPGQVNHFQRLGIDVAFDLDEATVDRRYFDLQRLLHPDRFATRTPKEKALSQMQATSLNEAYESLKDPVTRADYLLQVKGTEVLAAGCHLVNDPALLMEAMERREALAEAETRAQVIEIAKATRADMKRCEEELAVVFADENYEAACKLTTRFKYLRKLADEVRARKAHVK